MSEEGKLDDEVIHESDANKIKNVTDAVPSQGESGLLDNTSTGDVSIVDNSRDKEENVKLFCENGVTGGTFAKEPSPSIYFSNEKEEKVVKEGSKPPKRMTKAARAAMEALAMFGGSDFGSLAVRKIDLKNQLMGESEEKKKEDGKQKDEPERRPRTRLERAREEVAGQFRGTALGEGTKKYAKVMIAKQLAKQQQKEAPLSVKHQSRLQRSRALATASFGGVSLHNLPVIKKPKMKLSTTKNATQKDKSKHPIAATHTLTRSEKARLEALATFEGNSLGKVLGCSKKRVARHVDLCQPTKRSKIDNDKKGGVEEEDGSNVSASDNEKENVKAVACP